jgi:hypothetical protein
MEEMLKGQIDGIPLWAGADEMNKQIENYRDQGGDMRDVGIHLRQLHDEKARMKVQEKRDREQKEREDLIESTQTTGTAAPVTDPLDLKRQGFLETIQAQQRSVPRDLWTPDQQAGNKAFAELVETYRRPDFSADKPALDQLDAGSWYGNKDIDEFAGGGMTRGNNLELVGEEGPELVDLPPGSFVLPLKQLNQRQMLDLKRKGVRGYQSGGIALTVPSGRRLPVARIAPAQRRAIQ